MQSGEPGPGLGKDRLKAVSMDLMVDLSFRVEWDGTGVQGTTTYIPLLP